MASLQFPHTAGLLTPSSSRGSTTAPRRSSSPHAANPVQATAAVAAPKLRDSCHACASSKVKCHKEKPACSRCTKRGLTCEYVATKRVGRKHDSRLSNASDTTATTAPGPSNNDNKASCASQNGGNSNGNTPPNLVTSSINVASQLPALSSWFATSSDFLPTLANVHPSPGPAASTSGGVSSSGLFPNVLSPGVDQTLSSVFTSLTNDLDDFFASPVSFSDHDGGNSAGQHELLGQPDFYSGLDGSSSGGGFDTFTMFEKSIIAADLPSTNLLGSPPNSRASPSPIATSAPPALLPDAMECDDQAALTLNGFFGGPGTNIDSHCCCLIRALGLMKQLFPDQSSPACFGQSPSHDNSNSSGNNGLPTIQTVISKNEHTIKAVSKMLQCACSQDGYLLAVMSLIVFKVLGWYAAAARQAPAVKGSSSGGDTDPFDGSTSSNPSSGRQSPLLRQQQHHRQMSAASARRPPSIYAGSEQVRAMQGPAIVGSYTLDGEDSARMAGQLVLSELHRVQRLVNELSTRLKSHATDLRSHGSEVADLNGGGGGGDCGERVLSDADATRTGPTTSASLGQRGGASAIPPSPFSADMLDQLASDIRKRLRALSLEIVDGLRRD